ncbi:MAG: methylmalonyl-CoA epimerase [Anaerolineae bacterium]|nr:methylmalonyl-CoA epimerase [Anaerolineae bacterium]
MIKKIDHVAIVVEDIERALGVFREALGLQVSQTQSLPEQGVTIAFLPVGESEIELLEPLGPDSGVARFLATRGEGLHHICLEVEDIDAALAELKGKGLRLINETAVAGAHGRVAFIHPKSTHGVMVELLERPGSR